MFQRASVKVGYNIQASVDKKHKLFVHNDTGAVNDSNALATMAIGSKELLQVDQMDVLADKGYTTGKQINQCQEENITTYSSPKAHSSQNNGLYDIQVFKYDKEKDQYQCPNNQVLQTNGAIYNKNSHFVKHYKNRKACMDCQVRALCTANKNGRFIERSIYQQDLEENQNRVNNNPDYYRERQQIIEHQFGTLKRQWGFTYTLLKGKENVLTEVNIAMICYNLRRLVTILEPKAVAKILKLHFLKIKGLYNPFLASLMTSIINTIKILKSNKLILSH